MSVVGLFNARAALGELTTAAACTARHAKVPGPEALRHCERSSFVRFRVALAFRPEGRRLAFYVSSSVGGRI